MQLLTTSGYKNIEDCQIGEQLVAYEVGTGVVIINELLGKEWFSPEMFQDEYSEPEQVLDEEGNPVYDEDGNPDMTEPVLIKTKEQIFQETYGDLTFRKINDTWDLFINQSVWANLRVVHASDLQIGDIVYNDEDEDVEVTSIVDDIAEGWWRLSVSGDHSYIADDLTLHNASRYWVGGGSSANWNATGNTNWGSTSGGSNNASVPTSADDVTFDGAGTNGNTNSTISATITILSLNITTGYTATMTHNAILTIAGNWTYGGTYTIAGTSTIILSAACTITSNGKTWPNALSFSGTNTKTLNGDLSVSGQINTAASANVTLNKTTTETITVTGGLTFTSNATLTTNTTVILTGGTWQGTGNFFSNLTLNGNITVSGTVRFSGGAGGYVLTYQSGTITTTGSTLSIIFNCTLNTNGITWNNFSSISNTTTITLTSNLTVNGLLTVSNTTTINKTASETITVAGGLTMSATLSGTADIYLTGGTWSGNGAINVNLYLNGNITVSSFVTKGNGLLVYQSGTVTTAGSTLNLAISSVQTLDTNGVVWNNITPQMTTITLLSNLNLSGNFISAGGTNTINTSNGSILVNSSSSEAFSASQSVTGTAKIVLRGGIFTVGQPFSSSCDFDGNVTISGSINYNARTLTYISGKVTSKNATLRITTSATMIGFNKCPITSIIVVAGQTLTVDQLPCGTPSQICTISSSSPFSNYTIAFQDNFEKIGRFVAITGATLSRPMQLLITNNLRFNTNRNTNGQGIRYYNQSPNGFPKNKPSINDTMTVPALGLVSDPNFIKQG